MSMEELPLTQQEADQAKARLEAIQAIQGDMGWRWFIAEINTEINDLDLQLRSCDDLLELGRLQGRREAFSQIIHFEDTVDNLLRMYNTEDED
jgi:hypothetical protein